MLRGVRGATTVDCNERDAIRERVSELLLALQQANQICPEDIGAIIFSATPDLNASFPAAAARHLGWTEVPLFGTQEIEVPDAVSQCIRVLILWNTDASPKTIRHMYLHGAIKLRPDYAYETSPQPTPE